jgi:hypothetical protein
MYAVLTVWVLSTIVLLVALSTIFTRSVLARLMFVLRHRPDGPPAALRRAYAALTPILHQRTSRE